MHFALSLSSESFCMTGMHARLELDGCRLQCVTEGNMHLPRLLAPRLESVLASKSRMSIRY
jgi:hypothetical protein